MTTDNPDKVEAILQQAVDIVNPAERAAYLDRACGDDSTLRAEIESLLKAHQEAGTFLDSAALDRAADLIHLGPMEEPGTVIGHYRLLEKIGEGGMATVYMAEQERPIRRKVALKIIKLGMDSKQVIARFEAERQALALMDHPNIAKVFDGGTTETGRPYFVMELVKGVAITEYCDKNNLNTRQRLELFIQVCQAVQHAHQKGIIHRDIKPSNVLVTHRDGTAVPKVIDFGIAKATNQRLTEKTVFTRFAQMIGTPAYMSPEQAQMSELDVDTRTDVYSLGVLLYELLTGSTPFNLDQLRKAGYAGIQRIIRETEPVKPSTKLSTLGRSLSDIAQHRQTAPETLTRMIRGDLDWIVMKTLEKDRTGRYETAHALAEDIHRHLKHEPITAGRPGPLVRCRKFAQRHRALVMGAAAVMIVLLAGIVVSTHFAIESRDRLRQYEAAEKERRRLENERRLSTSQRFYEAGHYQDALVEVESYWGNEGNRPEAHLIHARLLYALNRLGEAASELEALLAQSPNADIAGRAHHLLGIFLPEIDSRRAEEHRRLGEMALPETAEDCFLHAKGANTLAESVQWLSRALVLDPSYYPARKSLALAHYGLRDFQQMEHDAEVLILFHPKDSLGYALRAIVRRKQGRLEEAIEDHNLAIRLCQRSSALAELHDQRRATWAKLGNHLSELQDAKQCAQLDPTNFEYQFNVFAALVALKDYEAARGKHEVILEESPKSQRQFIEETQKYVFNTLGAGDVLELPESILFEPIFSVMQDAIENHLSLSAKAERLLPNMAARMSWSPDSRYLAYGRSDRYVSDLGMRSAPTEFLSTGIEILDLDSGQTRLLVSFGKDPAWSPNGEYIAFVHGPMRGLDVKEEVWVVPARGGEPRRVAMGGYPSWEADSRHVIFHSRIKKTLCSVDIGDPDADAKMIMAYPDWYPAVSPDGRYVARRGNHELSILDIHSDSVLMRCPTFVPTDGFTVNWSPDGKELSLSDPEMGLWIFDIGRQEIRQVVDTPVLQGIWSPDRSRMSIRLAYPYREMWLATLDPNKPTWDALAPALTMNDYVQARCERCQRLIRRCPKKAEEYLSGLSELGLAQFRIGRYEDTALALKTVEELRRTILSNPPRAVEIGLLSKALYKLNHREEADVCLARLRGLFRQGTLIHGQEYMYDAEKTLVAQDDRLSGLWHDLVTGRLAEVKQALTTLKLAEPNDIWMSQRIEGLRCALAMQYGFRARGQELDSEAMDDYEAAMRSDPHFAAVFHDLGWLPGGMEPAITTLGFSNEQDPASLAEELLGKAIEMRAENLIAHWTFDEGEGSMVRDTKGSNHGTIHGDPTWVAGRIGGALLFDGEGDYIDCGCEDIFNPENGITVSCWIKGHKLDKHIQAIVTKGDGSWRLQRTSHNSVGFHCTMESSALLALNGSANVDDGCWHHIVGVFDGELGSLYIDNVLDASSEAAGPIAPDDSSVWIGDNSGAPGNEWCGLIDDVRVYDRALDANDVAALAQTDWVVYTACPGLVSYWPGEGNARDTVGVNHIITASVAAPTFATGAVGQAFHFDESTVRVISPAYGIGDLQQFTMALWVRLDLLPQGETVSFLCLGREKAVLRCDNGGGEHTLHFYTRNANNVLHHIWAKNVFEAGALHHIAGTYDGQTMRLYLDGVEVGDCSTVGLLTTEADNGVEFGQDNLCGFLDEIQVYSRPLGGVEIAALARRGASNDGGHGDHAGTQTYDVVISGPADEAASVHEIEHSVLAPAEGIDDLQQFSIALWVKLNSPQAAQIQDLVVLDSKAGLTYDGQTGIEKVDFCMEMTDGTFHYASINGALEIDVYHHVVGTYDGHAMRLFLNGKQVNTRTPTSLSMSCGSVRLSGDGYPVYGVLDEVQIYDCALSMQEIQGLYSNNGVVTPAGKIGPISWWHLDETSGTTAHDCVGPNDGTVQGATWTADGKVGGALCFNRKDDTETQ